jgi:hypothetical protein
MDEQTREPDETQEHEDLQLPDDQAEAVTGGASDAAHAGEIIIESRN